MYYVYILRSINFRQLYIGFTTNLAQRLKDHNKGRTKSTKPYLPWKIAYYEAYANEEDAKKREKQLKHFGKVYAHLKRRIYNSLNES